jgi:hypothetical protein
MATFGQLLRKYRRQCHDPLRGGMLTQERLGELIGVELGDAGYSGAAVSDWERDKSKIAVDDRLVPVSLIALLHGCDGLAGPAEADELLAAGHYRALNESESRRAFPDWPPGAMAAAAAARQASPERAGSDASPKKRRKKLILLGKVRSFWIDGVLERSLQDGRLIEVALLRKDEAVEQPWRYACFLDYAAGLVFLRRVGGGYIFLHRQLQGYFASLSEGEGLATLFFCAMLCDLLLEDSDYR